MRRVSDSLWSSPRIWALVANLLGGRYKSGTIVFDRHIHEFAKYNIIKLFNLTRSICGSFYEPSPEQLSRPRSNT